MVQRVVIVTGAGRGLGRAIALSLAHRGCAVALAGRSEDQLARVGTEVRTAGGEALAVPTDIMDASSVQSLFDATLAEFGRLDGLVNNAGVTTDRRLIDMTEAEWERIFDTNVRGVFLCSRAAARHFETTRAGRAVNIASVFGLLGRPGFTAYGASKGAIINFTRAAAAEWARFGAQINTIAPGYFATDINAQMREDEATYNRILRRIPARRMGDPEELGNLASYLVLDAPDFLTGQTIALDGGESSV